MHFEGQGEQVIEERLRYELFDTLFSMGVGWAINSAMVILAATTFFAHGMVVDDLAVAAATLPFWARQARPSLPWRCCLRASRVA